MYKVAVVLHRVPFLERLICNEHRYLNCSAYVIKKQISEDKMKDTAACMWGM